MGEKNKVQQSIYGSLSFDKKRGNTERKDQPETNGNDYLQGGGVWKCSGRNKVGRLLRSRSFSIVLTLEPSKN